MASISLFGHDDAVALVDQSAGEFTVLMIVGLLLTSVMAVLLVDYRGTATRYAARVWRLYQRPRRRWLNRSTEARGRLAVRIVGGFGTALGLFFVGVELAAVATGRVAC